MKIKKTIINNNLLPPDGYTVTCAGFRSTFNRGEEKKVGEFIKFIWNSGHKYEPAYVYYNIGWDADGVLYCKYEQEFEWDL